MDNGDAFLDTEALEKKRGVTIYSKQAVVDLPTDHPMNHSGEDIRMNRCHPYREKLLVDDYNIIHAWNELKNLLTGDTYEMDGAKYRFFDILSEYRVLKDTESANALKNGFDLCMIKEDFIWGSNMELLKYMMILTIAGSTHEMLSGS